MSVFNDLDIYVNKKYFLLYKEAYLDKEYYAFKHPSIDGYVCYVPADYVLVMGKNLLFKLTVWDSFEFVFERYEKVAGKKFKKIRIAASELKKVYEVDAFDDLNFCIVKYSVYDKNIFLKYIYSCFIKVDKWFYSFLNFERKRVKAEHTELIKEKLSKEEIYSFIKQSDLNSLCSTLKVDYIQFIKSLLFDTIRKSESSLKLCNKDYDFYNELKKLNSSLVNSMKLTNETLDVLNKTTYSFDDYIRSCYLCSNGFSVVKKNDEESSTK